MVLTAARRIPLVGRQELLARAGQHLHAGGVNLLYIEGECGIGKTAVLEAVLAQARDKGAEEGHSPSHVATGIVDLDFDEAHAPEGLIHRIVAVVGTHLFEQTCQTAGRLDGARAAGSIDLVRREQGALYGTFLQELAALTGEGLVLAFDTLEALECERDPFPAEAQAQDGLLSAGRWLFDSFFPALTGTALVLLAGRPGGSGDRLRCLQERLPHIQVGMTRLEELREEETVDYLDAVARSEAERGDADAAARLQEFAAERGKAVHLLTAGRPVALALVAELVAQGWALPACFGRTLEELRGRGTAAWWPEIEPALVTGILESPTPIGETLLALAWLRKGATPRLLARLMNLTAGEGQWDLGAAEGYMEQAARLALVKVRPGDGRVLLQEQVAVLLEVHVLPQCSQQERDRVYRAIVQEYDDQVAGLEETLDRSAMCPPLTQARLDQAYLEQMHYALRHRPPLGLAIYSCLADGALGGDDDEMGARLGAELVSTVSTVNELGFGPGLDLRQVEIELAVRRAMRLLLARDDPQAAISRLDALHKQWTAVLAALPLLRAQMQLYQAAAFIRRGTADDWLEARALLQGVQRTAGEALKGSPAPSALRGLYWWAGMPPTALRSAAIEGQHWRARALKAMALWHQGTLDRQQGRYTAAVQRYQSSAALQRRLAVLQLAPMLADLSGTMALLGQFESARLIAKEAERWARRSGRACTLALALNARALVEAGDDRPAAALDLAGQALNAAAGLRAGRLQGLLALTRARAHRMLFATGQGPQPPEAPGEALEVADLAVELLQGSPPDLVAALIERGSLLREMARAVGAVPRDRPPSPRDMARAQSAASVGAVPRGRPPSPLVQQLQAARWAQRSKEDLTRAATLATAAGLLDQQAGAWASLAWLWYEGGRNDKATSALQQATAAIPHGYSLPSPQAQPPLTHEPRQSAAEGACLPYWSILGTVELLKAQITLERARAASSRESKEQSWHEAVRLLTVSLAYEEQVAADHAAMRRAEASIHQYFLRNRLDITALHQHARQAAVEEGLQQPTRFQRFLERLFGPAELWA